MEPSKHEYDYDVSAVVAFLERYKLGGDFKINLAMSHRSIADSEICLWRWPRYVRP